MAARDYNPEEDVAHIKTFAAIPAPPSVRLVAVVSVENDMGLFSLDAEDASFVGSKPDTAIHFKSSRRLMNKREKACLKGSFAELIYEPTPIVGLGLVGFFHDFRADSSQTG